MGVNRHQLEGVDAQFLEVAHDGAAREAQVAAAQVLGHLRVQLGQALYVGLVDDGLRGGDVRRFVVLPVEVIVYHDAQWNPALLSGFHLEVAPGTAHLVAEHARLKILDIAHRAGIRVEQPHVGVEAQPTLGRVRAVNPVAVELAGAHPLEIDVPHERGLATNRKALLEAPVLAAALDQTQLD